VEEKIMLPMFEWYETEESENSIAGVWFDCPVCGKCNDDEYHYLTIQTCKHCESKLRSPYDPWNKLGEK
jgi:hypothetical protein